MVGVEAVYQQSRDLSVAEHYRLPYTPSPPHTTPKGRAQSTNVKKPENEEGKGRTTENREEDGEVVETRWLEGGSLMSIVIVQRHRWAAFVFPAWVLSTNSDLEPTSIQVLFVDMSVFTSAFKNSTTSNVATTKLFREVFSDS